MLVWTKASQTQLTLFCGTSAVCVCVCVYVTVIILINNPSPLPQLLPERTASFYTRNSAESMSCVCVSKRLPLSVSVTRRHTCSSRGCTRSAHGQTSSRPPSTHLSHAVAEHWTRHVCCYYTLLSEPTEGEVTLTHLSSVPLKRTTDNFAFEGSDMHEEPKRLRAGEGVQPLWPFLQNQDTRTHSNRWGGLLKENRESPFSFLFAAALLRTAGRQTFLLLSEDNKRVCGTPFHTLMHLFHTQTHTSPPPFCYSNC